MTKGQSLELFFIDGRPDGMLTAEVFNWTGHVLMTPRTQLAEALKRREASYTGVYILLGELADSTGEDSRMRAYIGESENLGERIKNHDQSKDWWTSAILIASTANNLHKAHIKYLESRLVEEAHRAGRFHLENGNVPQRSSLSEAAATNMEQFLEYLLLVLPALRVDGFLVKSRPQIVDAARFTSDIGTSRPVFELRTLKHGVEATAILHDGDFIVQAGSRGRLDWSEASTHAYKNLFKELCESGVLAVQGDHRVFSVSYAFKSPSAAAAALNGRPSNGPVEWRVRGNTLMNYKDWESEQLRHG